ncbi:MAG: ring-1,2-phenylacetyl-CoA epoxidase subunit PaaE [Motiliproteus sp.]|jgi:ring-1,2-phenylacetyl-CoA epoxidase subunit PaaE
MSDTNFYPLTISDVQPETDTAIRVSLEVPEALQQKFSFIQGQFLTLKTEVEGKELRRSYSICSGINEGKLQVGIKRVEGGAFSNFANDHFKSGDSIEVMPPQGNFYTVLHPDNSKNYMCIAAGSGITPMLSIIKSVLAIEPNSRVTLLYGNLRSNTVMFKEELCFIKNRYLQRFQWINIMDQEDQGADLLNGRIDNKKGYALKKNGLIDIRATDEAFICGPEAMMAEVSRGFRIEGLNESQIHYELFATSASDAQAVLQKAHHRVEIFGEQKSSKVTVMADGRSIQLKLATVGQNILDAGLEQGMDLPFSCKAGVCSTCKCKLVKGEVEMDITHGLQAYEIEAGYILSCQSHPISDEVVVDFDQR